MNSTLKLVIFIISFSTYQAHFIQQPQLVLFRAVTFIIVLGYVFAAILILRRCRRRLVLSLTHEAAYQQTTPHSMSSIFGYFLPFYY